MKFGPEGNTMVSAVHSCLWPPIKGFQVMRKNPLWVHRFEVSKVFIMWIIRVHVSTE